MPFHPCLQVSHTTCPFFPFRLFAFHSLALVSALLYLILTTNTGALCADALMEHEADLAPFCELSDEMATFAEYVQSVRSSSRWGGHVELRALSLALSRPIHVYSAATAVAAASTNTDPPTTQHLPPPQPLILDDGTHEADAEPIRLCYHLHYYALGEHYNTVVPVADDKKEVDES